MKGFADIMRVRLLTNTNRSERTERNAEKILLIVTVMCKSPLLILLTVCLACGLGCGSTKPTPATHITDAEKGAEPPENSTALPGTIKAIPTIDENSAAAAVLKTLKRLEAGNLAEAYDFLPPSYQADLDGLLHDFATAMDPELWSRMSGTARKAIKLLQTRKDLVLDLDLFRHRPEAEPYRQHWDSTLTLLAAFVEEGASDLTTLKKRTVRSLLPGESAAGLPLEMIGKALGANLAQQFAGVTVTPVRTDGAEQVVAIRGPHDAKPTEFVYVQHDGQWLPKSLVEGWNDGIQEDQTWIARLPERLKAVKPRLLDALSDADEILDQLQTADNKQQFEQAAGPAILTLATAWPNLMSLYRQAVAGQQELPHISISINRELTERELSQLVAAVMKPLREAGSDYTLLANDGKTYCRLVRINDLARLRQDLATHFSIPLDDVQVDREEAALKIDLAP